MPRDVVDAMQKTVLIETYWNVNARKNLIFLSVRVGINRNILECK